MSRTTIPDTSRDMENACKEKGYNYIIGVDEVGRGCLAGPVTVAACILPEEFEVKNVKDSKKFSSTAAREKVYNNMLEVKGFEYEVLSYDAAVIDQFNILQATLRGMKAAVEALIAKLGLDPVKCFVLVDGDKYPKNLNVPGQTVLQGDSVCKTIAAASIVAKVVRDRKMVQYHETYPEWNFPQHKGYGTQSHRDLIRVDHYTPLHRKSFNPLKTLLE